MELKVLSLPKENSCGCADRALTDEPECLCPATGLVQILGRKFALPLLSLIADRESIRFNELRSEMGEMSSSTLTIRLVELERSGLIHRQAFIEIPPRVEYTLTKEGEKLRRSLIAFPKPLIGQSRESKKEMK